VLVNGDPTRDVLATRYLDLLEEVTRRPTSVLPSRHL